MLDRSHNFIGKMTYIWKSSYIKGEAVRLKERRTCLNGAGEAAERSIFQHSLSVLLNSQLLHFALFALLH